MIETAKALAEFYSGFGLPAYSIDTVPDDVDLPYITFNLVFPQWDIPATHYCNVFYRTTRNSVVLEKAEEIARAIGTGLRIPTKTGCVILHLDDSPITVEVSYEDPSVRYAYIPLQVDALHTL